MGRVGSHGASTMQGGFKLCIAPHALRPLIRMDRYMDGQKMLWARVGQDTSGTVEVVAVG